MIHCCKCGHLHAWIVISQKISINPTLTVIANALMSATTDQRTD